MMHQQEWLAVIEELGRWEAQLPIPNSTPGKNEATKHSYYFLNTSLDEETPHGRWTSGPSLDGRSEFSVVEKAGPMGQKPSLGKARPGTATRTEQQ